MRRSPAATIFIYAAVVVLVISILAPVFWLFVMSISPGRVADRHSAQWFPEVPDFSRYVRLFSLEEGSRASPSSAPCATR